MAEEQVKQEHENRINSFGGFRKARCSYMVDCNAQPQLPGLCQSSGPNIPCFIAYWNDDRPLVSTSSVANGKKKEEPTLKEETPTSKPK
jgi:hypothetical protein